MDICGNGTPEGLYGWRNLTAHLWRYGLALVHCTVDRLMRGLGLAGVSRDGSVGGFHSTEG
ncbi:transposase [Kocuria oxytropis]|uniref:transposase n=1 Tax=Kocuria oxytropis TaxID=3058913 RepID=UPI0034D6C6F1